LLQQNKLWKKKNLYILFATENKSQKKTKPYRKIFATYRTSKQGRGNQTQLAASLPFLTLCTHCYYIFGKTYYYFLEKKKFKKSRIDLEFQLRSDQEMIFVGF